MWTIDRRMRWALVGVLAVLAGGLGAWSALGGRPQPAGPPTLERLDVYGQVPPFSLVERSGRRVTRDDLRGLVWVADFIYTDCTDTCPTQSLELARLQDEFAAAANLRLVSITVDPAHDTPDVLRRYAERYRAGERWWFLTGDRRGIYCLASEGFRLSVSDPSAPAPSCGAAGASGFRLAGILGPAPAWAHHGSPRLFVHSARFVLVDGRARIRAYHPATDPASLTALRANLRRLIDERP